ncbi:MAG: DNA polymerase III subunit gamma/tau [Clostridia bacterium]|nr:DNA polymerase III subunit gamma/tau [Clostridia bacterium]
MAYLALYRKYRPTGFDGLIGQDHVVTTLVNQIESGRIGHAYLFTGTRGTGKTSAAKIFAKAINCLSPKNGSPCGMCEACRALADPSNLDVMEIDAASNNGVAEIRDLREKITFPPVSCRYKVYIVDEVHMLSSSAFNALLKTLEEPPKHAVFILATTEVHKMPQTILSRCMRFDFKLVPTPVIAELLKKIFRDVGKDFEDEAVTAIARAGEGSVRDALSIADLCVSYSKEKLTYRDVLEVLGSADKEKLYNFTDALLGGDAGGVLSAVNELASTGKSMGVLTNDITGILRELLVARTCKNANEILGLPEDVFRRVSASAAETDAERLLRCLDIFARAESDLKYAVHHRVVFETAAVKAATPACDYDIEALMARVKELERKLERGVPAAPAAAPAPVPKASEEAPVRPVLTETAEPFPAMEEIPLPRQAAKASLLSSNPVEVKGKLSRSLRKNGHFMLWTAIQDMRLAVVGSTVTLYCKTESDFAVMSRADNVAILTEQLSEYEGVTVKVALESGAEGKDSFDSDVDEIKKIFGEDIVIVK